MRRFPPPSSIGTPRIASPGCAWWDRTAFIRQFANVWGMEQYLWRHLPARVAWDPAWTIVDKLPAPRCPARARTPPTAPTSRAADLLRPAIAPARLLAEGDRRFNRVAANGPGRPPGSMTGAGSDLLFGRAGPRAPAPDRDR